MKCRKCGANPADSKPVYLERVNAKGIPGIWECRPVCNADLPQETLLMMAIDDAAAISQPHGEANG